MTQPEYPTPHIVALVDDLMFASRIAGTLGAAGYDVRIVATSRVRPLDAPMLNLLGCLTRSGAGAGAVVGRVLGDLSSGVGGQVDHERVGEV